ncbi:WG repeat-containing protein [Niabella sp. CJ426]|uniref:WG repeat-containing protein n=1 Tax=Niabella sp. CJ426 TaxID=3393740 RepID=UPI003D06A6A2
MKKYITVIVLSLYMCTIQAQTKQDLLNTIDKDITSLKTLLKVADMRIELTAGTSKEFDASDGFNFEQQSLAKSAADKDALNKFFSQLKVHSKLFYPYNIVSIGKDEFDLLKLLGRDNFHFSHNPDKEPTYTPTRITFLDGTEISENLPIVSKKSIAAKHATTEKEDGKTYEYVDEEKMTALEKAIWESSSFDETIALQSSKPIKSISYHIELPVSSKKLYEFNTQQKTVHTIYGAITLEGVAGTKVYCTVPETDRDGDIQIEAYYKNGKVLRQKGSNSNTVVTDSKRKVYQEWITTLEKAKERVNKNEIKSDKDLKDFLTAHPVQMSDEDKKKYKSSVYTFSGPVSKVVFIVTDSVSKTESFDLAYDSYNANTKEEPFVATDFETGRNGLLNKAGQWVVKPRFSEDFRPVTRFFYRDQLDDIDTTYHYDPSAKAIQKVDYTIDDPEIYDGKYVKIIHRVNGPKGIANVTTGKVIVPVEYDYIFFRDDQFWVLDKNGQSGVMDRNFKIVLPIAYKGVDAEGGYISVREGGSKKDIYDARGKNITNGKYDDIKGTFSDGLLLVGKRYTNKEGYINTKNYFIDTLCNVKIDLTAKGYEDAEAFSAGLAVVRNSTRNYGYINTRGELIIPCQYKYARHFYPTSQLALVQLKDDSYVMIDKKGNIVKKLSGSYSKSKFEKADRASRILMTDQRSFNEYGEELEYNANDYW